MSITRKKLRELCFQIIFEYDFYPGKDLDEQMLLFLNQQEELSEEDRGNIMLRCKNVISRISDIDRDINAITEGWTVSRMSRVDLSIIRLAVFEMRFDDDVPVSVAINEAVELAKNFGGDESPKFVNGVLAKFAKITNE